MFRVEPIVSLDDPRLQPYKEMRQQYDLYRQEIFIAEGEKVLRRVLLQREVQINSVLLLPKWLEEFGALFADRTEQIEVFTADRAILEQLIGYKHYQGLLAVCRVPCPTPLEQILRQSPRPYFFVATDELNNAENLGVLVRNATALGAQALINSETSCSPYLRRSVRSSMGNIFRLPFVQSSKFVVTLGDLRSHGIRCVAAHPHTDQRTIYQADFTGDCCIVFGSEGIGISKAVLEACDECVAIPMQNDVDSLNVGSASAAFLFEVNRQRQNGNSVHTA
ncbi:MAG: RNA methyltransferase [Verrucomicrobia bacterium]|nr:RNA methyltransferase [Verrucomicrobiota bacterium]